MAEEIKFNISLGDQIKQIKELHAKNIEGGAYNKSKDGNSTKAEIDGLLTAIEKLSNQSLGEEGLKELKTLFNQVADKIGAFISKIENVSEETQKLTQEIKDLEKKKTGLSKQKNEVKTKIAEQNLSLKQWMAGEGFEFHKKGAKGQPLQADYKTIQAMAKHTEDGTGILTRRNKDGGLYAASTKDQERFNEQIKKELEQKDEWVKTIQNLDEEIKTLTNTISTKVADLKASTPLKDTSSLSQLTEQTVQGNEVINKGIDIVKTKKIEKKRQAADSASFKTKISDSTPQAPKMDSTFKGAFKQFTLYAVALRSVKKAIGEAVSTIRELDKSLTEQAMVTGLSRKQTYGLIKDYQALALQVGATTKEVASVATEYMKQGKTIQESLTLTKAAVAAAKVARVSVGDSVNYLTTALNGFKLSTEDAMRVSDKFAAVAASSATDYDELAIALSKVASQANLAGMSIDYTTALLTKGLETTREAPETMGTALKTIIARMREMSDYGETLEGDTDINNVESQLAHVGIALRNEQGELRSTQDVLDELGRKWDELNKNQQAALAKALAGTRQQSRLIAMMQDYGRVIELQELAERSAGATSAQAATYLEGMEAAMNKIQVAWESVITTVTNSEVIIGVFNIVGEAIQKLSDFLSNPAGMTVAVAALATIGMTIVAQKTQQYALAKMEYQTMLEQNIAALEKQKIDLENAQAERDQIFLEQEAAAKKKVTDAEELMRAKEELKTNKKNLLNDIQREKVNAKKVGNQAEALAYESWEAEVSGEIATIEKDRADAEKEVIQAKQEHLEIVGQHEAESLQNQSQTLLLNQQITESENALNSSRNIGFGLLNTVLTPIRAMVGLYTTLKALRLSLLAAQKASNKETIRGKVLTMAAAAAEKIHAAWSMATSAAKIPIVGWGIAIGILALIAVSVAAATKSHQNYMASTEKVSEDVAKMSAELYKAQERFNALSKTEATLQAIDNKVIKTKDDLKAMNEELAKAGEQLSDEAPEEGSEMAKITGGLSEREYYNQLSTDGEKRKFLEQVRQNTKSEMKKKREEIKARIKEGSNINELLQDGSVRSAIYANNNAELYDHIDSLEADGMSEQSAKHVESFTKALLENLDAKTAWEYAQNPQKIKQMTDAFAALQKGNEALVSQLESDDTPLKERVHAYEALRAEIKAMGDPELLKSFETTYKQWEFFADKMSDKALDLIDSLGLTNDAINKIFSGYEQLKGAGIDVSKEEYQYAVNKMFDELDSDLSNFDTVLNEHFGSFVKAGEDFEKQWNAIVTTIGDQFATSILDMGQNMEKFKNTIDSFYDKANKWSTLKESEKTAFISENAELFKGAGGDDLLHAFESGNYEAIETQLGAQMEKRTKEQLASVRRTLAVEMARTGDARNEAYIKQLKEYEAYLSDTNNVYKASLKDRLDREQKALNDYKDSLKKEQDALTKSLEQRKEAYEKYFDKINQTKEDQDYEEQAELLQTNAAKLASATDSVSNSKRLELEQQLKELEKERIAELRERAQEAITENMDDNIEQINQKFDDLLENNRAMLAAMTGKLQNNPLEFLSGLLGEKLSSGATALEMSDYVNQLQSIYGGLINKSFNWDELEFSQNSSNQNIMNIAGVEYNLNGQDKTTLGEIILRALNEMGSR